MIRLLDRDPTEDLPEYPLNQPRNLWVIETCALKCSDTTCAKLPLFIQGFFFSRWCTRSMRRVRIPTELRTLLQFVNGREKTYYLNKCDLFFIPMTFLRVRFVLSDLATALTRVRDGRHSYSSLPQLLYLFFLSNFSSRGTATFYYTLRCASHPSTGDDISCLVCSFYCF